MDLIVRVSGRGISPGFNIIQHLLDEIGACKEKVAKFRRHNCSSAPDQGKYIFHRVTQLFHLGKTHGCGCTLECMYGTEDFIYCPLVRALFKK